MAKNNEKEKNKKVPFAVLRKGVVATCLGMSLLFGSTFMLTGCGEQGPKGDQGAPGATWYSGVEDPTSSLGKVGDFYFETDDGDVWQYTQNGWVVISNLKGSQGDQGDKGDPGDKGDTGASGATWLTGTFVEGTGTGIIAEVAGAKVGDLYFNTTTCDIYQCTATNTWSWISNIKGESGNSWLTGNGLPDGSLGKNGDIYLDKTYSDIYEKIDGVWSWFGNIKENVISIQANDYYLVGEKPTITLNVKQSGNTVEVPVTADMIVNEPNWDCVGVYNMTVTYCGMTVSKSIRVIAPQTIEITTVSDYKIMASDTVQQDTGYNEYVNYTDISAYDEIEITCTLWVSAGGQQYNTAIILYNENKTPILTLDGSNLADYGVEMPELTSGFTFRVDSLRLPVNGAKYIRFSNRTATVDSDGNYTNFEPVDAKLVGYTSNLTKQTSAVSYSVEKVRTSTSNLQTYAQGGASYDKFLFQFSDKLLSAFVLDLENMTILDTHTFPETNAEYHCNNVTFGTEIYGNTGFPLLYVSMENTNQHKALVYAVSQNENDFNFELVQTIIYPSNADSGLYYQNCFVDGENGYIYVNGYSVESYSSSANGNVYTIKRYKLPTLADGENYQLTEQDLLYTTSIPFAVATQGGFIKDNQLIQVFGVEGNERILRVVDFETGTYTETNLNALGLTVEPESIYYYNGNYYITDVNENIWKITINPIE